MEQVNDETLGWFERGEQVRHQIARGELVIRGRVFGRDGEIID